MEFKHWGFVLCVFFLPFVVNAQNEEDEVNLADIFLEAKSDYQNHKYKSVVESLIPIYDDVSRIYEDTVQFVYMTTIIADSYYSIGDENNALKFFNKVDSLCTNKTNPKLLNFAIFSLTKKIELLDKTSDYNAVKTCIQKVFVYYPSTSPLDEQYSNILLYTTTAYINHDDSIALQSLSSKEYPRFYNATNISACDKYLVTDAYLNYLEKKKSYSSALSFLNKTNLPYEECTTGLLFHQYQIYSATKEYGKLETTLSEKFPLYYQSATTANHAPFMFLSIAQKQYNLDNYDSTASLLTTIEQKHWENSLGNFYAKYVLLKANNYAALKQWSLAEDTYNKGIEEAKTDDEKLSYYSDFANYYDKQGNFAEADVYYNKTLRHPKFDSQSKSFKANLFSHFAYHNQLMGKWSEADISYTNAVNLLQDNSDVELLNKTLNNQAVFFLSIGKNKEALDIYNRLLIATKTNKEVYIDILQNKASTLSVLGDYTQAATVYEEVYSLSNTTNADPQKVAEVVFNKAFLHIKQKKYAEAELQFKQLLSSSTKYSDVFYSKIYSNLAESQEHSKKYEEALQHYQLAYQYRQKALGANHPEMAIITSRLARVYWVNKNYTQADDYWYKSLRNYNSQIKFLFPTLTETERVEFYNTFKNQMEQFNSYVEQRYTTNASILDTMFNYQVLLQGLMFRSESRVQQMVKSSNDASIHQLYEKLLENRETISSGYSGKFKYNMDSLLKVSQQLEKELMIRLKVSVEEERVSAKDVAKSLRPEELSIQCIRFRKYKPDMGGTYVQYTIDNKTLDSVYYFMLCISNSNSSITPIVLKVGSFFESRQIKFYLNSIKFDKRDTISYKHFWASVDQLASQYKHIYVVPDGIYNLINPVSLIGTDGNLLLNKYTVTRISSVMEIIHRKSNTDIASSILLLGNPEFVPLKYQNEQFDLAPLPATLDELKGIQTKFAGKSIKSTIVTGKNATEESFRNNVQGYGIIHLATHGFFLKIDDKNTEDKQLSNPLFSSGVFLIPSATTELMSTEDGILSSYEVASMDLTGVKLVVLSACESGLGVVKNGEGVYGLQRALRTAGAQCIVMSLWKVDDEATAFFMKAFYDAYLRGDDFQASLLSAQQETKKVYENPKYWSAFCLIGL